MYLTTRELCAYCQTSVSNQCANRSKKLGEQKEIQISAAYEYVEAAGTGLSRGLNPTPCWLASWIESRRVFCSTRHASICRHPARSVQVPHPRRRWTCLWGFHRAGPASVCQRAPLGRLTTCHTAGKQPDPEEHAAASAQHMRGGAQFHPTLRQALRVNSRPYV